MSKTDEIIENVFPGTTKAEDFEPQTKTIYLDKDGKEIAQGTPNEAGSDWVARVASMSLSVKVTPKVGDTYVSVERALTIEVNTKDKKVVDDIWKELQRQVVAGTFNSLAMVVKQLSEVKKGS